MSVFKLCWKIIWGNVLSLSLYLGIFLVMSLIIMRSGASSLDVGFSQSRVPMALRGAESDPLVAGLKRELVKTAVLVDLPSGPDPVMDALFFGQVGYVVDVPPDFSKAFMKGSPLTLTSHSRPDDPSGRYLEMTLHHYFRLAGLYRAQLPQMGAEELVASVAKNLAEETRVVLHQGPSPVRSMPYARGYFNFMSYSLFNLLILGICTLMLVFNHKEIRLRNRCSPISLRKLNSQLFLAGLVYALICWLVMSVLCLLLQGDSLPGVNLFFFLLNSLVFTLWAASAAFAIGQFTEKREALSGMATVVTLVTSFLGGAFVPQEFLSGGLLKFSQFLPTYWYVRANNRIAEIGTLSHGEISPTLQALGMQLLFALAFISVALLVSRKKRQMG